MLTHPASPTLLGADDSDLPYDVVGHVANGLTDGRVHWDDLSGGQQIVLLVTELMMEVNSAGFEGYLTWDAGVRRFSALTTLAEVGGQKHAQLLRSALDRLRPEDRTSVDTHLQDALQGLSGADPFGDLDAEFWKLGEPSDLASYVRTNPDAFFGSQSE